MTSERIGTSNLSDDEVLTMRLVELWDHHEGGNHHRFLESLCDVVEQDAWQAASASFVEFVTTPRKEGGLGMDRQQFERLYEVRTRKEMTFPETRKRFAKMRASVKEELAKAPKPGNPTGANQHAEGGGNHNNIMNSPTTPQGTSTSYTIRRLKNEGRKDLAEKVLKGELSANAAAIEAGFRPRTATIYPEDLKRTARVLLKHFDPEELGAAIKEVR